MTNKEIKKLAQVIDAKQDDPTFWQLNSEERQAEMVCLITQFNRPHKNQQHKKQFSSRVNGKRVLSGRRTGRTVTVTEQSGRKTLRTVKAVKLPEEV